MSSDTNQEPDLSPATSNVGRSQLIFVLVGMAIILGGLWFLYGSTGPYHPDVPVTGALIQPASDS